MTLHLAQCQRLLFWCDLCAATIKRSELITHVHCDICHAALHTNELIKHIDLLHDNTQCDLCDVSLPPAELHKHKSSECVMRLVTCRYCGMAIAQMLLAAHQTECGARTIPCSLCRAPVTAKENE